MRTLLMTSYVLVVTVLSLLMRWFLGGVGD